MNIIEKSAGLGREGEPSLLERCAKANLAVLVNRPLNAVVAGHIVRLAEPGPEAEAEGFKAARHALARLEGLWGSRSQTTRSQLGQRSSPGHEDAFGTVAFDDFQRNYADPKTEAALAKLAHQVRDDERGRILMGRWMRDYLQAYAA